MFDISSKKNKYGDYAFYNDNGGTYVRGNRYKDYKDFYMKLPLLKTEINIEHGFEYTDTSFYNPKDAPSPDPEETFYATFTIDKEIINVKYSYRANWYDSGAWFNPVEIDFNALVRTMTAYACVKDYYNEFVLKGKKKEDLERLDYSDLLEIKKRQNKAKGLLKHSIEPICRGKKVRDAQEILDEVFGKDVVDLDSIVEKNVDKALQIREEEKPKEIAKQEKLDKRNAKIAEIKGGLVKLLTPVTLAANKVVDKFKTSYKSIRKKIEERKEIRQEKKAKEDIIKELID